MNSVTWSPSPADLVRDPMEPVQYLVTSRWPETLDTVTLTLEPLDEPIARFQPGQFTMMYAFGVGEIPVSISGDPTAEGDRLVQTVRDVGAVSHAIACTWPGQVLGIRGPFGAGWDLESAFADNLLIVAGGIGLAPVRPIIYEALAHPWRYRSLTIVVGARTPGDLLYPDAYGSWCRSGADVAVTVDRGDESWTGAVGLVTTPLADLDIEAGKTTAFVCGPEIMMRAVAEALVGRGVPPERIGLSLERAMKCGIGICGHCQLGPDMICRDGPCVSYAHAGPLLATAEL